MANEKGIKLVGAWHGFQKALSPNGLHSRLERQVRIANMRIGMQFEANVARSISAGIKPANSPLTVILKRGQSKPLVGRRGGDLQQATSFHRPIWTTVYLGVTRVKAGPEAVNIARIVHDGAVVDVAKYPQVRRKVFAMMREASGEKLRTKAQSSSRAGAMATVGSGGGGSANLWIIPPRRYIEDVVSSPAFKAFARKQWAEAVKLAIFQGKKGKQGGK